jgi:hypothetical protein
LGSNRALAGKSKGDDVIFPLSDSSSVVRLRSRTFLTRRTRAILALCSFWLLISPYLLGYAGTAAQLNEGLCGLTTLVFVCLSAQRHSSRLLVPVAVVGAWLFLAPLFIHVPDRAVLTEFVTGLLLFGLAGAPDRPLEPRRAAT